MDIEIYWIIFMKQYDNRCHGNTIKGFWALRLLSVMCWLVGDNLLLSCFGLYGLVFMAVCLLLYICSRYF
jgi:hypothetical protein